MKKKTMIVGYPTVMEDAIIEENGSNPVDVYFVEKSKWSGTAKIEVLDASESLITSRTSYVKSHDKIVTRGATTAVANLTTETVLLAVDVATFFAVLLRFIFSRATDTLKPRNIHDTTHAFDATPDVKKRDNVNVNITVNVN